MFDLRNKIKIFVGNGEVRFGTKVDPGFFPVYSVKEESQAKLIVEMTPWAHTDTLTTYARRLEGFSLLQKSNQPEGFFAKLDIQSLKDQFQEGVNQPQALVEKSEKRNPIAMAITDESEPIEGMAQKIVADHPAEANQYRKGKTVLLGFFVGLLLKATNGRARAAQASELMRTALSETV